MRYHVQRHVETETTASDTTDANVTTSIVVIATASQTDIAALTAATNTTIAQATAITTAAVVPDAPAHALPNQLGAATTVSLAAASTASQETLTVNNETESSPGVPIAPPSVPGRGDFLSPPILDPSIPVGVWDEALAGLEHEDLDGLAGPQPFVPWTAFKEAEEDLSEAAPSLLGAAGLAAVFWMSWNRRLNQREDERRTRSFAIPSPSDN